MKKTEEILTVNELIEKYLPHISQQFLRYHITRRRQNGLYKAILVHRGKIYLRKEVAIKWLQDHEDAKKDKMFLRN